MTRTEIARQRYCRAGLRYASDLTDAEWALIEPFMPMPPHRGRPRTVALRRIVEAIFYMLSTGCQWRRRLKVPPAEQVECRRRWQIPKEFAPSTPYRGIAIASVATAPSIGSITSRSCSAGNGRTRGVSHSRCDRQPVGQDHRSRGPARVRCRKEDQGTQAPHHHRI